MGPALYLSIWPTLSVNLWKLFQRIMAVHQTRCTKQNGINIANCLRHLTYAAINHRLGSTTDCRQILLLDARRGTW